jgi:asparagine synthase (glutamine-hydrolysing)
MPGIVGLITRMPREEAERQLREMVRSLCHETFYVSGTWADEGLGVYVGWVARKKSFSDGMPLQNEQGDVLLVFSGEEFPEPGTAQKLKERGHDLELTGPSYLVHLFEDRPHSFFSELNGRFHGLLIHRRERTATLFNDRYGMHRLYWYETKDSLYFAAEVKAILAVHPELRMIDPRALGEFVGCGCTLEGRTLFEGVKQLPGGSKWVSRNGRIQEKGKYFDPIDWENDAPFETEAFYREVRGAISTNIARYFAGQERIAMSLTGGLDTRMILAWQKPAAGSLHCYTFGSMMRENHDVRVARRVASACGQPFSEIVAGEEFLERFSHYAERAVYLTDGCVDVSRAPDLYLNEKAREIAPVRMTGNYGGEVLRGVRTFKPTEPANGLFSHDLLQSVREAKDTYYRMLDDNPVSFAVFKQMPWNHYGVMALEETQLSMRSPYLDTDVVRAAVRAPRAALQGDELCLRLVEDGSSELVRIATDRGVGGDSGKLLGAATRSLREFSFKAEYAYDMGMPQPVAKIDHALSWLHLERLFLGRHKVFHFRLWYRDRLAEYVKEMLLNSRSESRPYIDRKCMEMMVRSHLNGDHNYTNEIHKLLTLELVFRLFVDRSAKNDSSHMPLGETACLH